MKLHDIQDVNTKKKKKRIGRGMGSGSGKTAGKGHKGQKARSGGSIRPGFEGGQKPLQLRLPKRGFKNIFRKDFAEVNVEALNRFPDDTKVTCELLLQEGLIKKGKDGVKVLGNGELEKKLEVQANSFSKSAASKIEAAGGKVEVI